MVTAAQIIKSLNLQRNPAEGGLFASVYTAPVTIPDDQLKGFPKTSKGRPICSAIYYMIRQPDFSALHKVTGDMIYHFYAGDEVQMLLLLPGGKSETQTFGPKVRSTGSPMKIIPGGTWLGTRIRGKGAFALMGVSMSPGFDPADYSIGTRDALTHQYPAQTKLIKALTRQ